VGPEVGGRGPRPEARLRAQGIDPFDHDDADVDAILERDHDWQADDWLGEE
jgi:hypothetical protein